MRDAKVKLQIKDVHAVQDFLIDKLKLKSKLQVQTQMWVYM